MTNPELEEFFVLLRARIQKGHEEYGDTSFEKPIPETLAELEEEVLDLCGWSYVLWVQLRRRMDRLLAATNGCG